jgi:peptide-methionine (S)-S-oxide reductase
VFRTQVGYAGGTTANPTYEQIGDHAEAVRVEFDPQVISLDALLERFWSSHDPTRARRSQYRAELYCDDASCGAAERSAAALASRRGVPIGTRVVPGARFFPAEAYHQKWKLRRHPLLWDELNHHYAGESETLASVAAAKLNAYVAGQGAPGGIERDIGRLGLSAAGQDYLRNLAFR